MPQVILYAFGAIATGLLYAKRQFAITAAAPIGSSVVMIVCFIVFRVLAGPESRLRPDRRREDAARGRRHRRRARVRRRSSWSRRWRPGFSLRPRWDRGDPALSRFSRLAVWGVLLHSGAAMLLGASIVAGNGVAGGVVAYQVAFMFFLAPYAVLAQPIHTTILPEMSNDAAAGDLDAFARLDPLGARSDGAARDPGVGRAGRDRAPDDAARRVRERGQDRARAARRRASRRWRSVCIPTARSCCSRGATTRSVTAARRRSSRSDGDCSAWSS